MTTEYYVCHDSENLYAIGDDGDFFMMYAKDRHGGPWRFLAPGSEAYDYHHQKIFRQYDASPLERRELPEDLPALPPAPKGPFPSWAENQGKGRSFEAALYPRLAEQLEPRGEAGLTVYVVLCEDHYESMFGDGKSLDFDAAVFDPEQAERHIAEHAHNTMESRSIRPFTVKSGGGRIASPDYDPERYEHYRLEDVLERLEWQLKVGHIQGYGRRWGSPAP